MPFNIRLHTVHKHYAIQYHAAYTVHKHFAIQYHAVYGTQSLCHSISCCIWYAIIMPFNIMLHTVHKHYLFNIMLHTVHKHYAVQYQAAYSTQALCHSISCCIQYVSIMPLNIMLHTVLKHYAVQYHAAYSKQALCHLISCCIQYTLIMPFNIMLHTQR